MVQTQPQLSQPAIAWEPLPADYPLPDDPVENIKQPPLAAALTDALGAAQRIQPEMLIGSNFGLTAKVNQKVVVKAPDWFYVPRVHSPEQEDRRSYTQHLEGDRVAVAMEFLSAEDNGELSIRATPPYGKLYFYERILQVPTYVIYDPAEALLEVRYLENQRYALQSPNAANQFWIPELELFLGVWRGERLTRTISWLRWWDAEGNLLLWSSEQAEQERQRAEQERQRAEQERQRAEQERQRADRLAELLRSQGIDPDRISE
ncbi:Uma2 family endonuclease [Romeria aff. gracilis LEGE 07310]|uniref:Uma2 family endonuclease n=1 Tax=Vasconcelosia minhoensis LEGE 07310 TaxID=915328 RepID=A0A8J7AL57_9CYAN|nr:Uma2 family endonuclease [Romeria gracilis]MBE9079768.1 Uma2 family endonuclease [Romeria aff. gracilis LEGE 07310]